MLIMEEIKFPCKVGSRVYIKTTCENVRKHTDRDTGLIECPFESECEFEECKNDNERLFGTVVESVFNDGNGWHYTLRGLDIAVPLSDFGRIVFLSKPEAEANEFLKETGKLIVKYDEWHVPKELCTIDRLGGADDCMSCEEYCQTNGNNCDNCGIQKCFEQLAEYESTGLTPEQIKELWKNKFEKSFPILGTDETIPWQVMGNHRGRAIKNHYQSIERLAERGGLTWYETYCVLNETKFIPQTNMDEYLIKQRVLEIVEKEQSKIRQS